MDELSLGQNHSHFNDMEAESPENSDNSTELVIVEKPQSRNRSSASIIRESPSNEDTLLLDQLRAKNQDLQIDSQSTSHVQVNEQFPSHVQVNEQFPSQIQINDHSHVNEHSQVNGHSTSHSRNTDQNDNEKSNGPEFVDYEDVAEEIHGKEMNVTNEEERQEQNVTNEEEHDEEKEVSKEEQNENNVSKNKHLTLADFAKYKPDISIRLMIQNTFNKADFSDSTIVAKDVSFRVNSFMIKLHSEKLYQHVMESEEKTYEIEGYEPEIVEMMLRFFYCYDLLDGATSELFNLADRFEIMSLQACCIHDMFSNIDLSNILSRLELAFQLGSKPLKVMAIRFALNHIDQILSLPNWNEFAEKNGRISATILLNMRNQQKSIELDRIEKEKEQERKRKLFEKAMPIKVNQPRQYDDSPPVVDQRPFTHSQKRSFTQASQRPPIPGSSSQPYYLPELANSGFRQPMPRQPTVPTLFSNKFKGQDGQFEDDVVETPILKRQKHGEDGNWQERITSWTVGSSSRGRANQFHGQAPGRSDWPSNQRSSFNRRHSNEEWEEQNGAEECWPENGQRNLWRQNGKGPRNGQGGSWQRNNSQYEDGNYQGGGGSFFN